MSSFPLLALNPRQRSTRDLIFSILSTRFPLSLMELHTELRKQTKLRISYQGVRRALLLMKRDSIVIKKNTSYLLNPTWLEAAKTSLDIAYELSKSGRERRFNLQDLSAPITQYTCNSLYEADNFWGDLLFSYTVSRLTTGAVTIVSLNHSAWSMLFNTGRETELFSRMERIGIHTILIFSDKSALNRNALKAYHQVGSDAYIDEHLKISPNTHWNIIGDLVIQVQLQKDISNLICKLARQKNNTVSEEMRALLAHKKSEVVFTLQHNKTLAEQLLKLSTRIRSPVK